MIPGINTIFPGPSREPRPPDEHSGNVPPDFGYKEPALDVLVETEPDSGEFAPADRIEWREILLGFDGDDTTAKLGAHLDAEDLTEPGEIGDRHFSHLIEQLNPDRRVLIVQPRGASAAVIWFAGFPQPQTVSWSPRGQSFEVTCLDEGQERLARGFYQQILGRRMRFDPLSNWQPSDPDDVPVEALPAVFNAGGRPNRSQEAHSFVVGNETYQVHLFTEDDAPDASSWRAVDALRYVLFHYVLRSVDSPPVSVEEFLTDTAGLVGLDESPDDPDPFVRLITAKIENASIQSQSVREALVLLCDEARLHHEVAVRNAGTPTAPRAEHYVRIFAILETQEDVEATPERLMGEPKVHDVPREAPYTDMTGRTASDVAEANAVVQSTLSIDKRVINAPLYLGGVRAYEVTLLLRPLWLPNPWLDDLQTPADRDNAKAFWAQQLQFYEYVDGAVQSIYHRKNPQFHTVRDVGRLWGFPDDFRLMGSGDPTQSPYARANWPAHLYSPMDPNDSDALVYQHPTLGAGITAARDWVPRRRPFRETIGRREGTTTRAPVIWFNFDVTDPLTALAQPGWVRSSGHVPVDDQRAAVYIPFDNLRVDTNLLELSYDVLGDQGNMIDAYIDGKFMVAVTCTIIGDDRMYFDPSPGGSSLSRRRYQVHDHGFETFVIRDRTHNVFGDQFVVEDEPEYQERDDTERMEAFGTRDADVKKLDTISGSIEIFWLEGRFRVGDSFSGVEGLGIEFNAYPEIRRIQYVSTPGAGHRTLLHLTDLRDSPEIDAV